jgi:hypothetical protein
MAILGVVVLCGVIVLLSGWLLFVLRNRHGLMAEAFSAAYREEAYSDRLSEELENYRLAASMEADEVDHLSAVLRKTREELAIRSGELADAVAGKFSVREHVPEKALPNPPTGWVVLPAGARIPSPYMFIDDYGYRGWGKGCGSWTDLEVPCPPNGGMRWAALGSAQKVDD